MTGDPYDPQVGERYSAWDLIGFDGTNGLSVRVVGGRTLYEGVIFYDDTRGTRVKLARIDTSSGFLRQVSRYVDADTQLELVV
jgi:hypothetical protein